MRRLSLFSLRSNNGGKTRVGLEKLAREPTGRREESLPSKFCFQQQFVPSLWSRNMRSDRYQRWLTAIFFLHVSLAVGPESGFTQSSFYKGKSITVVHASDAGD